MIHGENISKSYEEKSILKDLNFCLPDKGIVAVSGKSGSGKTTLLRIMAGLEKPDKGKIVFSGKDGEEADPENIRISMVFQEDRLLKWESALENAAISGESRCFEKNKAGSLTSMNKKERQFDIYCKAKNILCELELGADVNTIVSELSGGMARRVAIARALTFDADIYIMDEPIKGLDSETAKRTLEVIKKYTKGRLLVVATHNPNEINMSVMLMEIH